MLTYRNWQPIESGRRIPMSIELRYCPTSEFHHRVDDERCPMCKEPIATAIFALAYRDEGSAHV